jgi:predicted nucleic acid-binding protein
VGDALILETTFLIDLEREAARQAPAAAHALLERHSDHRLHITPTVAGELAAGASLADRTRWEAFVAPFHVLALDRDVCWEYGSAFRYLQANGLLIGNDLWIAAAGSHACPSSAGTRSTSRVPGLEVIGRLGDYSKSGATLQRPRVQGLRSRRSPSFRQAQARKRSNA